MAAPIPYKAVGWRIWYSEDRVYEGDAETSWDALPDDGFLVAMIYFDNGTRRIACGSDYYFSFLTPKGPVYGQTNDPPEAILARYPQGKIKRGLWVSDHEMKAAETAAMSAKKWR